MNGKLCCVIVLSLVCGACANAARTLPTPEPTPIFVEGQSDLPTGKYIFAQSQHALDTFGECPILRRGPTPHGLVPCIYRRSDGWLFGWGACKGPEGKLVAEDGHSAIKGFLAWEHIYTGNRDSDHDSDISVVTTLPLTRSAGIPAGDDHRFDMVIHSINSQGGIVATICGQTRLLEPVQTMITQIKFAPYLVDWQYRSCYWVMTCRFTNQGLLGDHQIEVTPAPGQFISKYIR